MLTKERERIIQNASLKPQKADWKIKYEEQGQWKENGNKYVICLSKCINMLNIDSLNASIKRRIIRLDQKTGLSYMLSPRNPL